MATVVPLPRRSEPGVYRLIWAPAEAINQVRVFTLRDLVKGLRRAARQLETMARDGVVLGLMGDGRLSDDEHQHYRLLTTNMEVARRYGFEGLPEGETSRDKTGENKSRRRHRVAAAQNRKAASSADRTLAHVGPAPPA